MTRTDAGVTNAGATDARATVLRYLDTMVAHDWEGLAACVAPDVERIGPFGDVYRGRASYVGFLSSLMPSLPGYRMDVARVFAGADGKSATAELAETVELDGTPHRTDEGLIFDLDDAGLITRVAIYIRTAAPAVELPGLVGGPQNPEEPT